MSTLNATASSSSSRRKRTSDVMQQEDRTPSALDMHNNDLAKASGSTSTLPDPDVASSSRKRQATTNEARTSPTTVPDHVIREDQDDQITDKDEEGEEDYGAHYKVLLQALEVAVRKGANRWTAKDLKASYPHLSTGAERTKSFDDVWERSAREMREKMMSQAELIIQHYQVAPALKRLHTALEEARERKRAIGAGEGLGGEMVEGGNGRGVSISDVWRPNLSPQALTAAYNLPRYDAVYTRLREEYIQLYKDCDRLASEVDGKKRRMDEIKDQVVQANKQLEQTAIKLQDVPNEEIKTWMEDVAGNDRGMRTLAA